MNFSKREVFSFEPIKHGDRLVEVSMPRIENGRVQFSVDCDFPFDPKQVGEAVTAALEHWKKKEI